VLRHAGPKFPVQLLDPGIPLFHPGEDLADLLAVLLVEASVFLKLAPMLCDFIHLPENDLAQVPDHPSHPTDLASQIIHPRPHLREPSRRPVHMVPQDLREPFEGESTLRIRHPSLPQDRLDG
jgi:hypothetical protein